MAKKSDSVAKAEYFNIDIKETMFITWRLDIIFSPVYEEENFNELMREDINEKSNCFKFAYDYFIKQERMNHRSELMEEVLRLMQKKQREYKYVINTIKREIDNIWH